MRHRIRRQTMGKDAVKKSTTLVANIGNGSAAMFTHILVSTDVGVRNIQGATETIKDTADTDNVCNVGDIVKYLNICIQVGPRDDPGPENNNNGWLEYGIVKYKEVFQTATVANLGLHTLADVLTKSFRGDVLWTGCMPVGNNQPNSIDLKIKLPKIVTKMQIGTFVSLFCAFRSTDATDLRTDSHRIISSALYKVYS